MNLPSNYVCLDSTVAVHLSTIRRFSADTKALMSYLTIANQCDFTSDPNVFMEVTVRSDASTADVADRMREHGQIHLAISDLLQGSSWPDDELEPVFLRDDVI